MACFRRTDYNHVPPLFDSNIIQSLMKMEQYIGHAHQSIQFEGTKITNLPLRQLKAVYFELLNITGHLSQYCPGGAD